MYWEQLESSLLPIVYSRNSELGRQENLLFPISCSRNTVQGTKEVHETYLLQFRGGGGGG